MSKSAKSSKSSKPQAKSAYESALPRLQLALVRYQQAAMESGERAIVVLEGRDTAGKDGAIKRITEHLSPRNTLVAALPKPSDRERTEWYFQRYAAYLPAAAEIVIFNRSWYNRAGVEPVMGFCTPQEHERFLTDVPVFETMLVESGVKLVKIWLDISKEEQSKRLEARRTDPLKALKTSPLDAEAQKRWDDYTRARDQMLTRTDCAAAPWVCVRADHKKAARLNIIRHIIRSIAPKDIAKDFEKPDPEVLFPFDVSALNDGRLAR
jgi:polyphosphate kinase 2